MYQSNPLSFSSGLLSQRRYQNVQLARSFVVLVVVVFAAVVTVITVKDFVTVVYCILPGNCYQRIMSTQGLSKDVLENLECPACMQYMLPPITLCGNEHNISSSSCSCKQKIQKCPNCRELFSDTEIRHKKKTGCAI